MSGSVAVDFSSVARNAAAKYGLLPDIFARQIQVESGFNPKAISPAGARGIAQIMPATAKGWGVNPDDPYASLDAAAKNMAGYLRTFGGNYEKALRAYNAGPGAVDRSRQYPETNAYVQKILGKNNITQVPAQQKQQTQTEQTETNQLGKEALAQYLQKNNELLSQLIEQGKNKDPYGLQNIDVTPLSFKTESVNPQSAIQSAFSQSLAPVSYI